MTRLRLKDIPSMTAFIVCCGCFRVNDFASFEKFAKKKYIFVNALEIPRFFTGKSNLIQNVRVKNSLSENTPIVSKKSKDD